MPAGPLGEGELRSETSAPMASKAVRACVAKTAGLLAEGLCRPSPQEGGSGPARGARADGCAGRCVGKKNCRKRWEIAAMWKEIVQIGRYGETGCRGKAAKRWERQRTVASAFTSEQESGARRFAEEEEQRRERALIFCKKIGASDTGLAPTWSR